MKKDRIRYLFIFVLFFVICKADNLKVRTEFNIPNILDYKTLKCDFHMHTIFSDGAVWPPTRVKEAWRRGLDAISITEHVEYKPYKEDVPIHHNRSYELAKNKAQQRDIILIQGAEITRSMPPGHLNALFVKDAEKLTVDDPIKAIKAAAKQGAYIFYNHPGWKSQRPSGIPKWFSEHEQLYQKGWLKGVEIANHTEYYPKVMKWMHNKNLTLLGNSDIHQPVNEVWKFHKGEHRPMTFVFAKSRTKDAIREALEKGRTAVYFENKIMGRKKYLLPLFKNSIEVITKNVDYNPNKNYNLQIRNSSDIDYKLKIKEKNQNVDAPESINLAAKKTTLLPVSIQNKVNGKKRIIMQYEVQNMFTNYNEHLNYKLKFNIVSE